MDFSEFERRFILLEPLIRKTGRQVMEYRKSEQINVITKSDGSPVTNCDIFANEQICTFIADNFPGETVIGEESQQKRYTSGAGFVWYVDPIDGTKAFIEGRHGYFVLIGLCVEGVPVFGMVYQPEKDVLMFGWPGKPATSVNGSSAEVKMKSETPSWHHNLPVVMKAIKSEHRTYFMKRFNLDRAPFEDEMIDMLGSLYGVSNGYISYRSTAYWDLCAPAALLHSSGYRLAGEASEHAILLNDGNLSTSFYYCLPPDTPDVFIKELWKRHDHSH
ncbi:MAG: 3'(2'),5'-bisphosphate nucleotidase CysQ family protein [Cyclonatronaceae bacterium]